MGTPRVYFGLHLYSTAWPIYDLAQRLQLGVEKWRLALLMGFNGKVRCDQRREGGKEGVRGTWGRNGRGAGEGREEGRRRAEHKRRCGDRWMQINLFSALPEEPKTPTQQNKYRSPGGRAPRDKSL